jgi:ARC6-like, IMS domain
VNPAALQTLDNVAAEKILKTWLETKSAAMGPNYSVGELANVLTEPKLSYWQNAATSAKQENWYKKYKHDVKVITVRPNPQSPDQMEVSAEVSETEEYYSSGVAPEVRPAETLTLRYTLVRKDGLWRISDWR